MALVSERARNGCLRSYRGEDFAKCVSKNRFHISNNPEGIIDIGRADNRLCEDLLLEKLTSPDVPRLSPDVLQYPTRFGTSELRQSLESFMKKYFSTVVPFTADNLIVTPGAGPGLEELVFCVTDSGDTVLVPSPFWDKVPKVFTERCRVTVECVPTCAEDDYAIKADILENALKRAVAKGSKVAGILLINPTNPLGKIYSRREILDILEFAKIHSLHVILDEIYALSVHDGRSECCSALALDRLPDPERTHIIWAVSKDFGLTGYRCGVIVSWNDEVLRSLRSLSFHSFVPAPIQAQMAWLLQQHDWLEKEYLPTSVSRLREACDRCQRKLEALGVPVHPPQGGLFLWADFSKFLDEPTFAGERRLVERFINAGVYFRSGHMFYADKPGFFRIVFTQDSQILDLGLERIEKALTTKSEACPSAIGGLELDLDDLEIIDAGTTKGSSEGVETLIKSLKECIKASDWLSPEVPEREAQERVWTILDPAEKSTNQDTVTNASTGTETKCVDGQQQTDEGAIGGGDSLEAMMRSLKQSIKSSDWLESQEGAWEKENPEAAVEYRNAMKENTGDTECKTQ